MKILLFKLLFLKKRKKEKEKKKDVSLCHKDFKKHLLIKVWTLKNLFDYICRQLKYHQHKIRSKTGISLEIILNVFKCFLVSLVPLKFLLQQKDHFCLY